MKKSYATLWVIVLLILLGGVLYVSCSRNAPSSEFSMLEADTAKMRAKLGEIAGTYAGTLPCADCPGIETTLDVFPDGQYRISEKYIDRDGYFSATGYAKLSGDLLVLTVDNDRYFLILNADTLEKLDMNKQRVDTQSGMHLKRKTDGE